MLKDSTSFQGDNITALKKAYRPAAPCTGAAAAAGAVTVLGALGEHAVGVPVGVLPRQAPSHGTASSGVLAADRSEGSPLAIFWDIENCGLPHDVSADAVGPGIRRALREHPETAHNPISVFSAYGDFSILPRRIREGAQRTGVNLVDVPNGRKDTADKAILVDLFLFAMDNPPPATVFLITSDVDFALALQKLSMRGFRVLLAVLGSGRVSPYLTSAAGFVWDWGSLARGQGLVEVAALNELIAPADNGDTWDEELRPETKASCGCAKKACKGCDTLTKHRSKKVVLGVPELDVTAEGDEWLIDAFEILFGK